MTLPVIWHPGYTIAQPPDHPFPMGKFTALGALLQDRGHRLQPAAPARFEWLRRVHTADYLAALAEGRLGPREQRRTGFACTPALYERCRLETGGTVAAVRLALAEGLACNAAGGTHHAHADFGSGYCLLNDLAVATRWALEEAGLHRVLILDLDVHQGDGTARLLQDEPRAFTFSLHCRENFPARKARSDYDLELPRGSGDAEYLEALGACLPWLLDQVQPELVILDAGVDVHQDDRLGYLRLSDGGLLARDEQVLRACRQRQIPTAAVIGGGYDRDLMRLARRHALLFEAAARVAAD